MRIHISSTNDGIIQPAVMADLTAPAEIGMSAAVSAAIGMSAEQPNTDAKEDMQRALLKRIISGMSQRHPRQPATRCVGNFHTAPVRCALRCSRELFVIALLALSLCDNRAEGNTTNLLLCCADGVKELQGMQLKENLHWSG